MLGVKPRCSQPTFGELEYESKKRKTRREIFLERMDGLIPWGSDGRSDLAVLSESGPGPAALRVVVDAADTLCAAVLQPPLSRGQALRGCLKRASDGAKHKRLR